MLLNMVSPGVWLGGLFMTLERHLDLFFGVGRKEEK